MSRDQLKIGVIVAAALGMLLYIFSQPIIVQPQSYHLFADQRTFLGVPNALDVFSNVFFLFVGLLGMREILHRSNLVTRLCWKWFFISILLVAPGSAYYHWSPNDASLVWDRLPMSLGFMALYIVILCEHISFKIQKFLFPALLTGVLSVFAWVVFSDLRFYFWVQFSSFVTIPLILLLFPTKFTHKRYYSIALIFYALAKWTELKDIDIFQLSGFMVSGHTLKHLLSALGLACLWWMIRIRKEASVAAAVPAVLNTTGQE